MKKDFEMLPHTADIKVRVYGDTLEHLFINALNGMFQAVGPHAPSCKRVGERVVCDTLPAQHEVDVSAPDRVALLVDFLSEALYLSDVHNQAFFSADIHEFSDTHIKATISGVPITGFEVVEIKAVTYYGLKIEEIDGRWQADIVFDI